MSGILLLVGGRNFTSLPGARQMAAGRRGGIGKGWGWADIANRRKCNSIWIEHRCISLSLRGAPPLGPSRLGGLFPLSRIDSTSSQKGPPREKMGNSEGLISEYTAHVGEPGAVLYSVYLSRLA